MLHDERLAYLAGRRLSRDLPDWELVTPPLPEVLTDRLTLLERAALEVLGPAEAYRWFVDGWESVRHGG